MDGDLHDRVHVSSEIEAFDCTACVVIAAVSLKREDMMCEHILCSDWLEMPFLRFLYTSCFTEDTQSTKTAEGNRHEAT